MYVLGLDAGGTKTVCLLADELGTIVGEARRSGANLQADGELAVETVLHDVMEEAIGPKAIVPAAICLGVAGVDRPGDAATIRRIMRRMGYRANVLVVNDAMIALEAGVPGQPGVVVISGTGSIAYGRNANGEAARADGWGSVLGDDGSGYSIGRAALRAVFREFDRRGPKTLLTELLLAHFGVSEAQGLIPQVYRSDLKAADIGALAASVQAAVDRGDEVSTAILGRTADELELAGLSVARHLGLTGSVFPFVLAGGIFRGVPWLREELERRLPVLSPCATVRQLDREPAAGAVAFALQEARGGAAIPVYKQD